MTGEIRENIIPGLEVDIIVKEDQRTGRLTRGIVQAVLTNSPFHSHGIKVRLTTGQVGRVQHIVPGSPADKPSSSNSRE
ncbi:TPA: YwbE family protein [Patescibacteria group bacterium]|nr:YwbE family protein [Patescibacteria group bacterium]HCU47766.1 YwbE family protein [Patescibacteria group bacterium]